MGGGEMKPGSADLLPLARVSSLAETVGAWEGQIKAHPAFAVPIQSFAAALGCLGWGGGVVGRWVGGGG